jgi:repressor LexA
MAAPQKRRGRRPVETLTECQRRTLLEVRDYIVQHRFPPTVQELADALGISTASVHAQINQLVRKGFLNREPRKARGLVVMREPDDTPTNLVPIPVLGVVAAGLPVFAEENLIGEVLVEAGLVRSGSYFALRVSGPSMVGAGIADGNLVIVRRQPIAESGDIVVALVDGETTVKRLSIRGPKIELCPENRRFRPIRIESESGVTILGRVVGVRRSIEQLGHAH